MSSQARFMHACKRAAVAQVVDRGYAASEETGRLGVSGELTYTLTAKFLKLADSQATETDLAAETRRLKAGISRIVEERDV